MIVLFLAPATILYLVFFIYPTIRSFYVSLFEWNGFTDSMKFIGLNNFKELFSNKDFWNVAFLNTVQIIFLGGVGIFALAFIFSAVLTTNIRGKKFFRALLFFPSVINPIAIVILWNFVYYNNWGLLNNTLEAIGLGALRQVWTSPENLFYAILVVVIWTYVGFYCVILLAALDRIPNDYIEAAKLEGANEFVIFFRIKLPLIWDVLAVALILWGIAAIKEFAIMYAWKGAGSYPTPGEMNVGVLMYVTAFSKRFPVFRMGYSTAMGVIMFLMVLVFVAVVSRALKRESIEY